MVHFGILCLAATGHLNTMFPLGQELQRRGHRVSVLSAAEAQAQAAQVGLDFCEVYSSSVGLQQPGAGSSTSGKPKSLGNIRQTLQRFAQMAQTRLQKAPELIRAQGIEVLLVDLSVFEGGTIAEHLHLPYITICSILPFYQDPTIPPIATTWPYNPALWAQLRNRSAYSLFNRLAAPTWRVIARYRQQWQLPAYTQTNDIFSRLAILSRHIPEFEFPRRLPPQFHFTGPFHEAVSRSPVDFPFAQLNGKPLIYASMGTMQNRSSAVFHTIAAACLGLDAQLVVSLGNGLDPAALPDLPGHPIVVSYAPQLELLQQAVLNITHAGLNTALESLSYGVPMVAIPVTDDQPGVAARIAWTGAGELLPVSRLNVPRLRSLIKHVLSQDSYKQNALRLQQAIRQTDGVRRAADLIERAALSRSPVG